MQRKSLILTLYTSFIIKLVMFNTHEVCLRTCIPGKASKGWVQFRRYSVKPVPIFKLTAFQDLIFKYYIGISYFHHPSRYNLFGFATVMMC